jgi:hypothetical protein
MIEDILAATPADLLNRKFGFVAGINAPNLRITIFEQPQWDHEYVIGADFAYGIVGRDYDAAVVLDRETTPVRQVAEVQGIIGERFDRVLYALHRFYNDAFIVGERQVGLPILRRLYDDLEVRWMYFDRTEGASQRRMLDKLGIPVTERADIALRHLRLAIVQDQLDLRSQPLMEQMTKLVFHERTTTNDERQGDDKLRVKLLGGGSPDLVYACSHAWHGVREVPNFVKPPKAAFPPGSMGSIIPGHEQLANNEDRISADAERWN